MSRLTTSNSNYFEFQNLNGTLVISSISCQGPLEGEKTQIRQTFLDNLPTNFTRQSYLSTAKQLNIPAKTADKYIKSFCDTGKVIHEAHRQYKTEVK